MAKFEDIKTYQECLDRLVLWAQEQDTSKTDLELDWILACMINRPAPNTIPEIQQAIWTEKELHPYSEDCQKMFDILDLAKEGELPRIKE